MALMTDSALRDRVSDALGRLESFARSRNFCGPDPYDSLSAPLARFVPATLPRQAVVQIVRRSRFDIRRLLRIEPIRMTKTLALFAHAYGLVDDSKYTAQVAELLDALGRSQTDEGGWGYEFDVQTRWGYYPAGSPNIVVTAFVLESFAHHGFDEDVCSRAREWLTNQMWHPSGFFRYVPSNDTLVHNANLLGARALARVASGTDDDERVARAVAVTLAARPPDGLWPYGARPGLEWVDSFHTCYILDSLTDLPAAALPDTDLPALVRSWFATFVSPDGVVAYYADGSGPIDVHNIASSVDLMARYWSHVDGPAARKAVESLLDLQRPDGSFAAPGRVSYMRWDNAHAFRALARLRRVLA